MKISLKFNTEFEVHCIYNNFNIFRKFNTFLTVKMK